VIFDHDLQRRKGDAELAAKDDARFFLKLCSPNFLVGVAETRAKNIAAAGSVSVDRASHIELFARAYALAILFGDDLKLLFLLSAPRTLREKRIDAPREFLKAMIHDHKLNARTASQRLSRDVRAMRYLLATNVPASQVVTLSKLKGEGLHAWAARATKMIPRAKAREEDDTGDRYDGPDAYVTIRTPVGGETTWSIRNKGQILKIIGQLSQLQAVYPGGKPTKRTWRRPAVVDDLKSSPRAKKRPLSRREQSLLPDTEPAFDPEFSAMLRDSEYRRNNTGNAVDLPTLKDSRAENDGPASGI
jgi:hypothetical protein